MVEYLSYFIDLIKRLNFEIKVNDFDDVLMQILF